MYGVAYIAGLISSSKSALLEEEYLKNKTQIKAQNQTTGCALKQMGAL